METQTRSAPSLAMTALGLIPDEETFSPSSTENGTNVEAELIFLGTGTSSSIPYLACLTAPTSKEPCRTCLSTLTPEGKKNIRRNTSAVVRVTTGRDRKMTWVFLYRLVCRANDRLYDEHRTLVIDAGKNFQAAALEWFPKYGLRKIDAVLITHSHADGKSGWFRTRKWMSDDHRCSNERTR